MEVDDRLGKGIVMVVVVVAPDGEDMGALIGLGCLDDDLVGNVPAGEDEIRLTGTVSPVQFINVGYEENLHFRCLG